MVVCWLEQGADRKNENYFFPHWTLSKDSSPEQQRRFPLWKKVTTLWGSSWVGNLPCCGQLVGKSLGPMNYSGSKNEGILLCDLFG